MATLKLQTDGPGYADRLVALLAAFADGSDVLSLSDLSERLHLPLSSVHRLLQPLVTQGFVDRAQGRRYRIGTEFFRLAATVAQRFDLVAHARAPMREVAERTQETCLLALLTRSRTQLVLAEKVDSPQPLRFRLHMLQNRTLLWGSLGRAMLANLDPLDMKAALREAREAPASGEAPPPLQQLMKELGEVQRRGVAITHGQVSAPDVVGLSAPIFGADGSVRASIGIVAPEFRFGARARAAATAILREKAKELSIVLGAHVAGGPAGRTSSAQRG